MREIKFRGWGEHERSKMRGIQATRKTLTNKARLYIKRPLPVLALQINQTFWVKTLEGTFQAKEGDYLIEGIEGELYSCDREIFEGSYDFLNTGEIASEIKKSQEDCNQIIQAREERWRREFLEEEQKLENLKKMAGLERLIKEGNYASRKKYTT